MGLLVRLRERRNRGLTVSGVIGLLAFCISLAWLLVIASQWSRERQFLRVLISSHFLYDILVGAALWYQTMRLERHQKTIEQHHQTMALMPSPEQLDSLEADILNRAAGLRADPTRSASPDEELKAADALERSAAFIASVREMYQQRETAAAQVAA